MSQSLIEAVVQGAIAHGQLDPKGKSPEVLLDEFARSILRTGKPPQFLFSIDHTATLRRVARDMHIAGQAEIAVVLLATWVEHVLNELVSAGVLRRGFSEKAAREVIRDVPLRGKLYWLLPLLGYSPLAKQRADDLMGLTEFRNQFVHYKWPYSDLDADDSATRRGFRELLEKSQRSIAYLALYRTRQMLRGSKRTVAKGVRGGGNQAGRQARPSAETGTLPDGGKKGRASG
jgi:hypothetical protein